MSRKRKEKKLAKMWVEYEQEFKPDRKTINQIKKFMGLSHNYADDVLMKEAYKLYGVEFDTDSEMWQFLLTMLEKKNLQGSNAL